MPILEDILNGVTSFAGDVVKGFQEFGQAFATGAERFVDPGEIVSDVNILLFTPETKRVGRRLVTDPETGETVEISVVEESSVVSRLIQNTSEFAANAIREGVKGVGEALRTNPILILALVVGVIAVVVGGVVLFKVS